VRLRRLPYAAHFGSPAQQIDSCCQPWLRPQASNSR